MDRRPAVVSPEATVKEAVVVMAKQHAEGLPVVDRQNRLLGLVSHHGIAIRAAMGDRDVRDLRVQDAMSTDTTSLPTAATLSDALQAMVRRRAGWLPVVASDKSVVGVVELADIVARASSRRDSRGAWLETGYRHARSSQPEVEIPSRTDD
jgi:CBS domain-containing protein